MGRGGTQTMNIHKNPRVTVLMSVYNGERYLNEAVDSILAQTFTDFEFLIIDDASTDRTPEILRGYDDPRIRIVTNEENLGLTKSLNKGLALARGEYIARMDADDISLPERLEKQISFLEKNLEIGVLGTAVQYIDEYGKPLQILNWPQKDTLIKWQLCFMNPIAHPSAIIQRELLTKSGGYDEKVIFAQDYDLWVRLSPITHFGNHKDILLYLRKTRENISFTKYHEQKKFSHLISKRAIKNIAGNTISQSVIDCILNERNDSCTREAFQNGLTTLYNSFLSSNTEAPIKDKFLMRKDIAMRAIMIENRRQHRKETWLDRVKSIVFASYYYPVSPLIVLLRKVSQANNRKQ